MLHFRMNYQGISILIKIVQFLHLRKNSIITKLGVKDNEEHKESDEDIKQITYCIIFVLY